jgi:hypothetical protein
MKSPFPSSSYARRPRSPAELFLVGLLAVAMGAFVAVLWDPPVPAHQKRITSAAMPRTISIATAAASVTPIARSIDARIASLLAR